MNDPELFEQFEDKLEDVGENVGSPCLEGGCFFYKKECMNKHAFAGLGPLKILKPR